MGICCLIFCAVCVSLTGKGGSTVYLGESKLALHYFTSLGFRCGEHQNPTDFMLDVIGGEVPRAGQPDFRPQVCTSTPVRSFAHTHNTHTLVHIPPTDIVLDVVISVGQPCFSWRFAFLRFCF